jgi:hypothetical protein
VDLKKFREERKVALLSMDEKTIRKFMLEYDVALPEDEAVFWAAVHKTRTACKDLPMEARTLSKKWLHQRCLESLDDGDVPV